MIRRTKSGKHFGIIVVLSTFWFAAGTGAFGKTPFELPYCPAVKDKQPEAPQQLQPIELGTESKKEDSKGITGKSKPGINQTSAFDKAKQVNCVPLPMIPSIAEREESEKLLLTEHKRQLQDLWAAAIERSPDIQFAISILQPNSNQKHATAQAMKLIGSTLFNFGSTLAPAGPVRTGVGIGVPMIGNLFKQNESVPQVSVGESIVLYKMVRETADGLLENYRNYRRYIAEKDAALMDLSDLDKWKMTIESETSPSSVAQFDYTLKKAQRDAFLCNDKVQLYRQKLLDLSGETAVAKLDEEIAKEKGSLADIIGRPDINPPLAPPKPATASELK